MRVLIQKWEESERGWGCRPDGFTIHRDDEARQAFIGAYWARMPDSPPDEYTRPSGTAYWAEMDLDAERAQQVTTTNGIYARPNEPYPGDQGPDGWRSK